MSEILFLGGVDIRGNMMNDREEKGKEEEDVVGGRDGKALSEQGGTRSTIHPIIIAYKTTAGDAQITITITITRRA